MIEDPTSWLDQHGDVLYRFAFARIRDRSLAEDLVQETLLGALKSVKSFEGKAEVRTWLIGILRNKIADHLRRANRQREDSIERMFDDKGEWVAAPGEWHDPEGQLNTKGFNAAFEDCLSKLPDQLAEAFILKEVEEEPPEKVCDHLEISATNLSTRLYRARLLLRKCLEDSWFLERAK